jgi:hypothetical protein
MPFVGTTNYEGDPKELLEKYDRASALMQRRERPLPGMIAHYCLETDTGIRVANCYETEQQLRDAYGRDDFRAALRQVGIDYEEPQIMRVHNYFHVSR